MPPRGPNAGGLPSGPRSRSVGRTRNGDTNGYERSTPSSSSRQQRSGYSRESSRPRATRDRNYNYDTRSEAGTSSREHKSDDSYTSAASSLFDRLKSGAASYTSSFTSAEEDDYEHPKSSSTGRGRTTPRRRMDREESPDEHANSGIGDGYTVWSRVASAASNLTVNVSKAWTANIATYTGEETPPGQESRLTRAMKAYHLEKARSPQDLPPWLFSETERQSRSRYGRHDDDDIREETTNRKPMQRTEPSRPRGLRDIYDSASSDPVIKAGRTGVSRGGNEDSSSGQPVGRGTDRLKALRAAKKTAETVEVSRRYEEEPAQERRGRPRIGLPSGPGPRR